MDEQPLDPSMPDPAEEDVRQIAPNIVPTFELIMDSGLDPEVEALCDAYWDFTDESGAGGTPLIGDYLRSEEEVAERFRDRFPGEPDVLAVVRRHSRGSLRVGCHECGTTLEAVAYSRQEVEDALIAVGEGIRALGASTEERARMAEEDRPQGLPDPRQAVLCPDCLPAYQQGDMDQLRLVRQREAEEAGEMEEGLAGVGPAAVGGGLPVAGPASYPYRVLQAPIEEAERLEREMAELAAKGYAPWGDLQVVHSGDRVLLVQAAFQPARGG